MIDRESGSLPPKYPKKRNKTKLRIVSAQFYGKKLRGRKARENENNERFQACISIATKNPPSAL